MSRFIVISVEAIYQNPERSLVTAAIQKLYTELWQIYYWATQERTEDWRTREQLQKDGLWDYTDPEADSPLLTGNSLISKRYTLEEQFGYQLDDPHVTMILIEQDPHTAQTLKKAGRFQVHLAPHIWPNVLALHADHLEEYLRGESKLYRYSVTA